MTPLALILAGLAVCVFAGCAVANSSAQGLLTHEIEEQCAPTRLAEEQGTTKVETQERCEQQRAASLCPSFEEACELVKAAYAAEVTKHAEEALADGEGVACVVTLEQPDASEQPDPEERAAEVLARCRALLAEKIAAAWSQPVSLESIGVGTHKGHSTKTPGYTTLEIAVSQFAHVRFTLRRHGHRTYDYVANQPGPCAGGAGCEGEINFRTFTVEWSCNSPGGIYRYTVEAWTGKNKEVRHGRFKPVSTEWCRTTARHEREARERKDREWRKAAEREHAEYVRREHEAEENCRKLGGTVVTVHGEAGPVRVCRSPEAYVPL